MKRFNLIIILTVLSTGSLWAQGTMCDTIRTFPWIETFNRDTNACWLFIDNDENGHNWIIGDINPYSESYSLVGTFSTTLEDNWAISPAIALSSDSNVAILSWQVYAHPSYEETYEVLVGTSGQDNLSSFDSVFGETLSGGYYERSIIISQYSGEIIHVAFRHRSQFQNIICIDDVSIRLSNESTEPLTVNIESPDSAYVGDLVTFNAVSENADLFEWQLEGAVTTSATGHSVTTSWPEAGRYIVSVTAKGDGLPATDSKAIIITEKTGTEGIANIEVTSSVYPNPTTGLVTIEALEISQIEICSVDGQTIKSIHTGNAQTSKVAIDLSEYPTGTYLLRVTTKNGQAIHKIIKR